MSAKAKLSENFEEHFETSKSSCRSRKAAFWRLIEKELEDYIEKDLTWESSRARLNTESVYLLYVGICRSKGKNPEFLFNGRDLIKKEEFERLDNDDRSDSEELRRLWKSLGKDRGGKK